MKHCRKDYQRNKIPVFKETEDDWRRNKIFYDKKVEIWKRVSPARSAIENTISLENKVTSTKFKIKMIKSSSQFSTAIMLVMSMCHRENSSEQLNAQGSNIMAAGT